MQYLTYSVFLLFFLNACSGTKQEFVRDANGNVLESFHYVRDKILHGEYIRYNTDGGIRERSNYRNGVLEGTRILYYPSGQKEIEETYKQGIFHGPYFNFHENGLPSLEANYNNGVMEGHLKRYYPSGKILEVVTMQDNIENGPFKEYYENGNIEWEGRYLNGDNEFGLLLNYDSTGTLIKKMMCDSLAICRTIWTLKDGDVNPKY